MNKHLIGLAASALVAGAAQAAPSFVNGLSIAASTGDQFGSSVNDGRLGMFSDLYYDRHTNEWWGLSDRGPGGGTISYETRVQRFTLDVDPITGAISNFQVAQTIKFSQGGTAYNGLAPNPAGTLGSALDPEGIAINPRNGNLLVSDEYGPSLYEFNRSGQLVRQYNTPGNLVPRVGAAADYTAGPTTLTSGREGNRGFEGLAVSPDGRYAYAMLQNGTVTDSNLTAATNPGRGMYTRIVQFDTSTGDAVGQFAFRLDGAGPVPAQGRGISAIVALDDSRFMVLERNNRGVGVDANVASPDKKVYIIDLAGASDVTGIDLDGALPAGTLAVSKSATLIDLAAASTLAHPSLAAMGGRSPEKWEGLTVGPQLADGSFLLLAGTDNDYSVTQNGTGVQFDVYYNPGTGARVQCDLGATTNCFSVASNGTLGSTNLGDLQPGFALIPGVLHAYKASAADLGGYLAPVPEPGTYALLMAGLLAVGAAARRQRG